MFSFFKKSKINRIDDKIWFANAYKINGLISEAQALAAKNETVVVVAFFRQTLQDFENKLSSSAVAYRPLSHPCDFSAVPAVVNITRASTLTETSLVEQLFKGNAAVTLLFLEHYPLYATEDAVMKRIEEQAPSSLNICFYSSLDDEIIKFFGAGRLKDAILKLGLQETETISHPLIGKAIANAQKKIQQSLQNEMPTESQQQWFTYNCKQ
jgi:hypothetical protein